MIAKISHGGSLYGVLAYNQIKVDELHADVLFGNRIIEPPGDNPYTIEHISRSFGDYLTANRKTEKPILHISLNPDPKDCVTEEQFIKLAEQYMQRMGFGDQPYIVYRHNDIGREHLHIVSVRVDETGRAISDSYEHERSMKVCRELEQQFGLTPATKKEWKEGLPLSPVDYGGGNLKGQLAGVIRPIAREWRFQSLGEYRAVLSLYGITVDEVKGEYGGREYHGLSYSATDKDGNKIGKPFKSSVFGKEAGITALEKRMLSSAAWVKSHKDIATDTAARIASAMQTAGRDRALFERELMQQGVGVVFRTNDAGRIYGRLSSTMPTKPFSMVPVWVRSFQLTCSTTFSPGRTVFTRRSKQTKGSFRQMSATSRKNHRANIRRSNRDIPVHPSGTGMIPGISPTIRTTPPKTWRTLSACSHPCRAAHPATSPHHRSGKRRKGAGTADNSNLPQYSQF